MRATDNGGEEIYVSIDISRDQLTDLIKDRLDDSIQLCRKIIKDNGYSNEDIAKIVPIGGPSKMPVVREMLQSELAIEVEQGLDPMTAVATGAAIFAESREWDGEKSARKSSRGKETVSGAISLELDYKARVSDESARIRVKPVGEVQDGFQLEVLDEEGGTTGKKPIDGPIGLSVKVRKPGENKFKVVVYDLSGRVLEEASREISITKTGASAASIPMTYTLAVKTQTGTVGYERNKLVPLLEKGTSLPAEGEQKFRSGKTLKAGEADYIAFSFYEMAQGVEDPEQNLHIGDFRLDSSRELEQGERINRGDELIVHWKMSDNGTLSFSVEIPSLGRLIDTHNLYMAPAGHVNFEGEQGSEIASALLSRAETDLDALDETLGGSADQSGELRKRIEQQHALLSTSTDADTHRSVAEEARKLRQQIALLRLSPENEDRVLTQAVNEAEIEFDANRNIADNVDQDRHDKLLATARRSIREQDYEAARRSLEEMRSIHLKVLSESPEFLVGMFKHLADEKYLAVDETLHDQLVAKGVEAIKAEDIGRLREVLGAMVANRVSTGGDATEIVELAHILGG